MASWALLSVFLLTIKKGECDFQRLPPDGCCFGKSYYSHGQTVTTLPSCCVSFICNNGQITHNYISDPSDFGCCEFDGILYPDGAQLTTSCVSLTCRRGSWVVSKEIADCCKHCNIFNDPHINTFDDHYYDWHGPCNYSIAQNDFSYNPQIGVYSDFRPCFHGASCLDVTTFKNDNHTVITLRHVAEPQIYDIYVNGDLYTVPEFVVQAVVSTAGTHPVLAWRDEGCIYLLGSSKIMILHCHHRLDLWAHAAHANALHGLCGHFNFDVADDFTSRKGLVHALQAWPLAFAESWRTNQQISHECLKCANCDRETAVNPCRAASTHRDEYLFICRRTLNQIIATDIQLEYYIDGCAFDLCLLRQSGASHEEELAWLVTLSLSLQFHKIILVKTAGLFREVPAPPSSGVCVPGSNWKQDCNFCRCGDGGRIAACTRKLCLPNYVHMLGNESCSVNSYWKKDECNWCHCVRGGQICTFNDCGIATTSSTTTTTERTTTTSSTTPDNGTPMVCFLPRDPGTCHFFTLRYYYDPRSQQCEQFYYGGCEGNANNFESEMKCLETCGILITTDATVTATFFTPGPVNKCIQPIVPGYCTDFQDRYAFNVLTRRCERFSYSGCGGNSNNFISQAACELECSVETTATASPTTSTPVCHMPKDTGTCYAFQTRYYYDKTTNMCHAFVFGGCGGNSNNFATMQECLSACIFLY